MTAKQFYDWQTSGGTDDVMRLVDCLERVDIKWCAISGVAVNHWAEEPMVTQDVDFVVSAEDIERSIDGLSSVGFKAERHKWLANFSGQSKVTIQLSTEKVYLSFPERSVAADVHGILLRVARYWHGAIRRDAKVSELRISQTSPDLLSPIRRFGIACPRSCSLK